MNEVYLVLEYEHRYIYFPFKNIERIDIFTSCYNNPQELCKAISDFFWLGIPDDEMLDVYLSRDIIGVFDDEQEFRDPSLAIQYIRHYIHGNNEININLANLISFREGDISKFSGLQDVINNYKARHCKDRELLDTDVDKMVSLYLGGKERNYLREKECYFRLIDLGYKFKVRRRKDKDLVTASTLLPIDDKELFLRLIDMPYEEAEAYLQSQETQGRRR